jgi:LysR family glycine cleavage system transcriptional activator
MQERARQLPLNGVRAFEAAARHRSLKAAAAELGVTPSAISHHVKQLERAVGTRLFSRRNNGIDLTADGLRFFDVVSPALATIARAGQIIRRDTQEVVLKVSMSFAVRWLIPRLNEFRSAYPRIRVKMETSSLPVALEDGIDLAIDYSRRGAGAADATVLLQDWGRPVASHELCRKYRRGSAKAQILGAPLISAAADDWDWRLWAEMQQVNYTQLRIVDRFDTDHAALEACVAGMGVYIPPAFLVEREMHNGILASFSDFPYQHFGDYRLITATPIRRAVEIFISWLLETSKQSTAAFQPG